MTEEKETNEKQLLGKIRTLERKVFELQGVLKQYREKFSQGSDGNPDTDRAREEIEKYNSLLISFSVAVQRLHSTFDYVEVMNTIKDICTNLVGAREYGIYMLDNTAGRLVLVTHQGFQKDSLAQHEELVRTIIAKGDIWIDDDDSTGEGAQKPKTCVPLRFADHVFGVLVIVKLLDHKKSLEEHDFEILRLLGKHAAMAIYSAKLYWIAQIEKKLNIRKEIVDLLPPSASITKDYFFPSSKK